MFYTSEIALAAAGEPASCKLRSSVWLMLVVRYAYVRLLVLLCPNLACPFRGCRSGSFGSFGSYCSSGMRSLRGGALKALSLLLFACAVSACVLRRLSYRLLPLFLDGPTCSGPAAADKRASIADMWCLWC